MDDILLLTFNDERLISKPFSRFIEVFTRADHGSILLPLPTCVSLDCNNLNNALSKCYHFVTRHSANNHLSFTKARNNVMYFSTGSSSNARISEAFSGCGA